MHKREFRQLVCAMLLGDSWIYIGTTPRHTTGYLGMEHSQDQLDYILWKKELLDSIFRKKNLTRRCTKVYTRDRKDKRTGNTYKSAAVHLNWKTYFSFLHKKAYKQQGKRSPKKAEFLLKNISTEKHLAIWMMDDCSESKSKAKHIDGTRYWKNPYFRLAINNFTFGEAELIRQWFNRTYEVHPKVHTYKGSTGTKYPILQFSVRDTRRLFPKIAPYIKQIPSMRKKFSLCLEKY